MLRLRTLSGSELSFISGMIVASQVLAWALILIFMSQVSLVKLLGKQMAGLTEAGSICCCTHCPCYLLHFLLPVDTCCFAWSFHSFNVIYLSLDLSKPEYLSATLSMRLLCLQPCHPGRLMTWLASVNPSGILLECYFLSKTFLDHSISNYNTPFFSLTLYPVFFFSLSLFPTLSFSIAITTTCYIL